MKNLFIYYLIYIWDRCNAFGVMKIGGQNRCNENRCNAFGVMKIGVMKIGGKKKRQQS